MGRMKERWKHAFAVDPPGPAEPNEDQRRAVDSLCEKVVRRGLTTPAITLLEMSRPLNFVVAQSMHVSQPTVTIVSRMVRLLASKPEVDDLGEPVHSPSRISAADWTPLAEFLEKRGSIEYMLQRLESFEEEYARRRRERRGQSQSKSKLKSQSNSDSDSRSKPAIAQAPDDAGMMRASDSQRSDIERTTDRGPHEAD